jgi:hypothetical protein
MSTLEAFLVLMIINVQFFQYDVLCVPTAYQLESSRSLIA